MEMNILISILIYYKIEAANNRLIRYNLSRSL